MIYREAGQFKASYPADQAIFPIRQDQVALVIVILIAVFVVPVVIDDYWSNAVLLPFFVYALAAMGLNILTGYCGQVSLGTGGFMAVGAYSTYKLITSFPDLSFILVVILSGVITAGVGIFDDEADARAVAAHVLGGRGAATGGGLGASGRV